MTIAHAHWQAAPASARRYSSRGRRRPTALCGSRGCRSTSQRQRSRLQELEPSEINVRSRKTKGLRTIKIVQSFTALKTFLIKEHSKIYLALQLHKEDVMHCGQLTFCAPKSTKCSLRIINKLKVFHHIAETLAEDFQKGKELGRQSNDWFFVTE